MKICARRTHRTATLLMLAVISSVEHRTKEALTKQNAKEQTPASLVGLDLHSPGKDGREGNTITLASSGAFHVRRIAPWNSNITDSPQAFRVPRANDSPPTSGLLSSAQRVLDSPHRMPPLPFPPRRTCLLHQYTQRRKFDEAESVLRQALSETRSNPPALVLLGRLRATTGKLDEAEKLYRVALEASPRNAPAHHALAKVFAFQQRYLCFLLVFMSVGGIFFAFFF